MTPKDKLELKELLQQHAENISVAANAKFEIIDFKLDAITQQTTKTNGRVNRLEERETTHIANCPLAPKVRALEDSNLATISKKNLVVSALGMVLVLVSIMVGTLRINEVLRVKETDKLQKANDSIMMNQAIIYDKLIKLEIKDKI